MPSNAMQSVPLSIIVPCYKVEKYLSSCLDSLLKQTLPNVEIICINDGSPDNCLEILNDYSEKNPGRIVVIDKHNEGVWKGRFDGIRVAHGEYIGFVDSDDTVESDFAETLYTTAKSNDADIAICGFRRVDLDTGKVLSTEMCREAPSFSIATEPGRLIELNGAPWNKIFRANVLKTMNNLQDPPKVLDDLVFHLLAYLNTNGKVAFSNKPLINYMVRSDSIINTVREEQVDSVYSAFATLREYYESSSPTTAQLNALDSIAFLHLGISLLFRLLNDPSCDTKAYITRCTSFLDSRYPSWRKSQYTTLRYAINHGPVFLKLWTARRIYIAKAILPFLKFYQLVISKLHIDIKW